VEIVNKITMKSIGAQPKPRSVLVPTDLAHIYGTARTFKEGSSTYGIFRSFIGEFEAVNLETGEVTRSNRVLLPPVAEKLLTEQMLQLGAKPGREKTATDAGTEGTEGSSAVDFAFVISVKPQFEKDGKTIVERGQGYEYGIRPLIESRVSDTLAHLREHSKKHLALTHEKSDDKKSKK
jgi:hypothetical protein